MRYSWRSHACLTVSRRSHCKTAIESYALKGIPRQNTDMRCAFPTPHDNSRLSFRNHAHRPRPYRENEKTPRFRTDLEASPVSHPKIETPQEKVQLASCRLHQINHVFPRENVVFCWFFVIATTPVLLDFARRLRRCKCTANSCN